ncbi:15516_t:CDS:2 [Gigaspora margarita]|uniref:15516_t:CDS:1 n=1 Tax=Gigaspora margarita TaxID=4874 RepID=A0ABN7UML8_GIGMA|nr:15516_t:CDS:2 [Gigaspora margarita]
MFSRANELLSTFTVHPISSQISGSSLGFSTSPMALTESKSDFGVSNDR